MKKLITIFEKDYLITNNGILYHATTNKEVKQYVHRQGYIYYQIYCKKKRQCYQTLAHRLVAIHFIDNPNNYPIVNHINNIKNDNRVSNLEWCTQQHNMLHAFNLGVLYHAKGEKNGNSKLTLNQVNQIRNSSDSYSKLAQQFGVGKTTISRVKRCENWN